MQEFLNSYDVAKRFALSKYEHVEFVHNTKYMTKCTFYIQRGPNDSWYRGLTAISFAHRVQTSASLRLGFVTLAKR